MLLFMGYSCSADITRFVAVDFFLAQIIYGVLSFPTEQAANCSDYGHPNGETGTI